MARQMVGPTAADDLVQDTFLRAWKYFDSFDATTNCRAWLFQILRNTWITRWRKSRMELPLADSDTDVVEPYYDWEGEFLQEDFSAAMKLALAALPDDYRVALLLADVEEFSYEEIARVMECPIGTVMSRLNRARRMLARLVQAESQQGKTVSLPDQTLRRRP